MLIYLLQVKNDEFFCASYNSPMEMTNRWVKIFLSNPCLSIALLCPSQNHSFTPLVETWMMWPWRVKIHATSPKVTKLLLAILYRILPNHTRGFVQISKLKFCQGCEAKVLSTLKHGIIKVFARICQSSYIYISCPLSNNTKLKLDLDFEASWLALRTQ